MQKAIDVQPQPRAWLEGSILRPYVSQYREHLQRGWLGHESPATTHIYLEADLAMKERTLNRLQPMTASQGRYRPPDELMQFLTNL